MIDILCQGLSVLFERNLSVQEPEFCAIVICYVVQDCRMKIDQTVRELTAGSICVFTTDLCELPEITPPDIIFFYEHDLTPLIYSSIDDRLVYRDLVLVNMELLSPVKSQTITLKEDGLIKYAVKRVTQNNSLTSDEMPNELKILIEISDLIRDNICPNLPLLYTFIHDDSDWKIYTEYAHFTLQDYLKVERSNAEILSAIFQIMFALYNIQDKLQIMHYDIKSENILCYRTLQTTYQYIVYGVQFDIPIFGVIFVLGDFGLSRSLSPCLQIDKEDVTRLGFRLGMVDVEEGRIAPLNILSGVNEHGNCIPPVEVKWDNITTTGGESRLDNESGVIDNGIILSSEQEEYLVEHDIPVDYLDPEFYNHPDILPPFEFFNDTQDVLKMFLGGKQSTQNGIHKKYLYLDISLEKELSSYLGAENMREFKFSLDPAQICAGYFIISFFKGKDYF
jgi:hypothetical protein